MNTQLGLKRAALGIAFLVALAGCGQTGSDPSRLTSPDTDQPKEGQQSTVAHISVSPDSTTVGLGFARQLSAVAYDSAGLPLDDLTISWSSSNTAVVTVDENGRVTGVGIGSATVGASCVGKEAEAAIVVRNVSVLVDASRDGGVWWFPQAGAFDPDLHHQGKAFADYLRSLGLDVRELPRPTPISLDLLQGHDLVVRAGACGVYADFEVAAYQRYVEDGGNLLLLDGHKLHCRLDAVGQSFGLRFEGISRGSQKMMFVPDPITDGVANGVLSYLVGSGLVGFPAEAKILAYLDEGSYLDLNGDGSKDEGEPVAPPVMGRMEADDGLIVFMGDVNTLEHVPQPLTDNIIRAFLPGIVSGPSEPRVGTFFSAHPLCVVGCS